MYVRSQRRETPTRLRRVVNGGARCAVAVRRTTSARAISDKTRSRIDRSAKTNARPLIRSSQKQHSTRPWEECASPDSFEVPTDPADSACIDGEDTCREAARSACAVV